MREHIDEGTLQSYLDGELSHAIQERVILHLASCDECALMLNDAQDELEMLSFALEPALSVTVPTESLREKINLAVSQNQQIQVQKESRLRGFLSALTSSFVLKPQFTVGFAAVILAVLIGAVFLFANRQDERLAGMDIPKIDVEVPEITSTPTPDPVRNVPAKKGDGTETTTAENRKVRQQRPVDKNSGTRKTVTPRRLEGEKSYLEAIATLEKAVVEQGDLDMRPTLRAEYEKNLAVVDKAINETQKQARKNPKDAGAVQLLYASYQSKIDLLNAVSSQTQLSASLK